MKATGAEIMAFYREWPLGKSFYVEDCAVGFGDAGGDLALDPVAEYDVEETIGYLVWQGRGRCPDHVVVNGARIPIPIHEGWTGPATGPVFRAWRGDLRPVVVLLTPDQIEGFKAHARAHGWKLPEGEA